MAPMNVSGCWWAASTFSLVICTGFLEVTIFTPPPHVPIHSCPRSSGAIIDTLLWLRLVLPVL